MHLLKQKEHHTIRCNRKQSLCVTSQNQMTSFLIQDFDVSIKELEPKKHLLGDLSTL